MIKHQPVTISSFGHLESDTTTGVQISHGQLLLQPDMHQQLMAHVRSDAHHLHLHLTAHAFAMGQLSIDVDEFVHVSYIQPRAPITMQLAGHPPSAPSPMLQ